MVVLFQVKFTEKPTYSTRRRKVVPKPRANSLFEYHQSNSLDTHSHSSKSDSSLPPSPRSLTGSRRSISNAGSLEENGAVNGRLQRSTSVCSTASESSYTSDPEDMTLNERRSRAQEVMRMKHKRDTFAKTSLKMIKYKLSGSEFSLK